MTELMEPLAKKRAMADETAGFARHYPKDTRVVYVGWTCKPRDNWKEYSLPPEAPVHYKDEKAIRDYQEKMWARAAEKAAWRPLTGRLDQVVMLDADGEFVKTDVGLWRAIGRYGRVCAFGVTRFLRLLQVMVADEGEKLPWLRDLLASDVMQAWNGQEVMHAYDPAVLFTGDSDWDRWDLVLHRFGLSMPEKPDAEQLARAVRSLDQRLFD